VKHGAAKNVSPADRQSSVRRTPIYSTCSRTSPARSVREGGLGSNEGRKGRGWHANRCPGIVTERVVRLWRQVTSLHWHAIATTLFTHTGQDNIRALRTIICPVQHDTGDMQRQYSGCWAKIVNTLKTRA